MFTLIPLPERGEEQRRRTFRIARAALQRVHEENDGFATMTSLLFLIIKQAT